jgi:hypothetical protein
VKPVEELLLQLGALGIRLRVDGERLHVSAPKATLTPDLQAELTRRKADIMAFLRGVGLPSDSELLTIRPVAREGPIAASFAQQRLWFVDQFEPNGSAYNVPAAYRSASDAGLRRPSTRVAATRCCAPAGRCRRGAGPDHRLAQPRRSQTWSRCPPRNGRRKRCARRPGGGWCV